MAYYFSNYIDKIKATKKLAREKNVPIWMIPFANAMGMILLTTIYQSVYTWIAIVDMENKIDYISLNNFLKNPLIDAFNLGCIYGISIVYRKIN